MNPFDIFPKSQLLTQDGKLKYRISTTGEVLTISDGWELDGGLVPHKCEPVNVGFNSIKLVCKHCDKEVK